MKKIFSIVGLFLALITLAAGVQAQRGRGQGQAGDVERELIRRELQSRISNDRRGNVNVRIDTADSFYVSNRENEIRGIAIVYVRGGQDEEVSYTAIIDTRNRRVTNLDYRLAGRGGGGINQSPDYNRPASGPVRSGRYTIQLVATNRLLDAGPNGTVVQSNARNSRSQQWDIEDAGNGMYYLRSAATGDAMTVSGRLRSGSTITLSRGQYNANEQLWQIVAGPDNGFYFIAGSDLALDSPSSARYDGGRMQVYNRNGEANQRFQLTPVAGYDDRYNDRYDNRRDNRPRPGQSGGYAGTGQLVWSGRVDDEIQLQIRGNRVSERRLSGQSTYNATYRFTNPLPQTDVRVRVEKLRGRGDVDVIEQPSSRNRYTAIIRIRDRDRSSDDYEIEVSWD